MIRRSTLLRHLYVPASIALAVAAVGLFAGGLVRQLTYRQTVASLMENGRLSQALILGAPAAETDVICKKIGSEKLRVTVIRLDGVVTGDSETAIGDMENHLDREEFLAARQGRIGVASRFSASVRRQMLYVALPAVPHDGSSVVVRVSAPEQLLRVDLLGIYGRIALAGLVLLAALTGMAILVERRRFSPIAALRRAAAAFAAGQLDHYLGLRHPPDLKAVADSLNEMAAALRRRVTEITEERNELQAVLSGMVEGVVVLDRNLLVRSINPSALRLAGRGIAEVQGASLLEVFHSTRLHDLSSRALACGTPLEDSIELPGSQPLVVQVHAVQLPDEAHRIVLVLHDITRLEALERVRRDFVANVSHELKTPITAIKGVLSTLLGGAIEDDPAPARRFLEVASRHSDRLASVIEDLLYLSRLEKKEQEVLEKSECLLEGVARSAMANCQERASVRGIELVFEGEAGLTAAVNAPLLERALTNLLGNAIEYSNAGSRVVISARRQGPEIALAVRDSGVGIPLQDLPRVFERFYRVDKGRSRELGGTGLGLAIVKHIVLEHGGSVRAESEIGAGSTFTILLPV